MKTLMDLRTTRELRELSQERLADLADVATLTISLIENGRSMPTVRIKRKLEEALGLRVNWLSGKGNRMIHEGEADFSAMEHRLRLILYDVNFLCAKEQREFIGLMKNYIKQATRQQNKRR